MKDPKRSARTLNTALNILFLLLLARGIFAAAYHAIALYRIFTDPVALSGEMGLSVDWLTIQAEQGFGIGLDAAVQMKLVQLLSAVVITFIGCCAIRVLKRILLPIEVGQPFRRGISADILTLSKCAFWLGMAENLSSMACVILIENHYDLPSLLVRDSVTGVSIDWDPKLAWFIAAAVLVILSMVFRQGEQLQTLADETL